eukprot:1400617-Pleurochrysis_carterae.AAC.1
MLRGTIDKTKPQDAGAHAPIAAQLLTPRPLRFYSYSCAGAQHLCSAGKHRCREKIKMIAGVMYKLELPDAAAHLVVDVWNGNFVKFHAKTRSPSAYGNFKPPHLRHEMCLHACTDTLCYQPARSDPKAHLPLHRRGEYDCEALRKSLVERADAFFLAAQANHLKWNATTWTKVRPAPPPYV